MTRQQYEWTEGYRGDLEDIDTRCLLVSDEYVAHHRALAPGETVAEALDDYASGYDVADRGDEERAEAVAVRVSWYLYEGGEEIDRGTHTFEVPPAAHMRAAARARRREN